MKNDNNLFNELTPEQRDFLFLFVVVGVILKIRKDFSFDLPGLDREE